MRPDFSLIWGADNAPFTPIEASDYTAGWVFRTGAPPRRVNFDYFQNLSDQRTTWLGEQMLLAVGHEWQDDVSYDAYAVVRSPVDGQLYRSLVGSNLNNEPSVSGAQWALGVAPSGTLPLGYFSGFTLANNGAAPNTTVDVAAGTARSSGNTVDVTLTGTLRGILQSSGAWAAGDNQNKLDTGARANNTEYHVFAIRKTSDGTGDILFSLSPSAPTMPSGYSGFRRISSVFTNGSGNLLTFINIGRRFYWGVLVRDVAAAGVPGSTTTPVLRVPTGVRVMAHCDVMIRGENNSLFLSPTDTTAPTLAGTSTNSWIAGVGTDGTGDTNEAVSASTSCLTNTSGQVRLQSFSGAGGNVGYVVTTKYWEEL